MSKGIVLQEPRDPAPKDLNPAHAALADEMVALADRMEKFHEQGFEYFMIAIMPSVSNPDDAHSLTACMCAVKALEIVVKEAVTRHLKLMKAAAEISMGEPNGKGH